MVVSRALACILVIALLPWASFAEDLPSSTIDPRAELVENNTQFALELYAQIARDGGNAVVSPLSVSVASALLYAGARGATETEIGDALHFGLSQPLVHSAFKGLLAELESRATRRAKLVFANGLWVDDECALLPEYGGLLSQDYGATAEAVDFGEAPAEASQLINQWVSEETHGKITSVVEPDMFSKFTRMTIVNAVYFLAAWEHSFSAGETKLEPFHLPDGRAMAIPMMHLSGTLAYYEDVSVQVLALPYQGSGLSMLVILPGPDVSLASLEERLTPDMVSGWVDGLLERGVEVGIPRFEVVHHVDLVPILTDLGMRRAFEIGEAELAGICADKDIFVERADHMVALGITERGTEAAATTVYVLTEGEDGELEPDLKVEFRADRPFMYLVRDMRQGTIIFMGRFVDPTEM